MEAEAIDGLRRPGRRAPSAITFARTADLRYVGQFHEVEVAVPAGTARRDAVIDDGDRRLPCRHEQLYTFNMPWQTVELLTFRLRATTPKAPFELRRIESGGADAAPAPSSDGGPPGSEGAPVDTPVYDGALLRAGNEFHGPAIIEETTTTVVIPPRYAVRVDEFRNYVLTRDGPLRRLPPTAERPSWEVPHERDRRTQPSAPRRASSTPSPCRPSGTASSRIGREMRHVIDRTAQSYLIAQLHDMAAGIWDVQGRTIAVPDVRGGDLCARQSVHRPGRGARGRVRVNVEQAPPVAPAEGSAATDLTYAAALVLCLRRALERDDRVRLMGQYFVGLTDHRKLVADLRDDYPDRVWYPPIAEVGYVDVLVDTAGIRRKGKTTDSAELLSVVAARKAMERARVAIIIFDASEGITSQDAHIAGYAEEARRSLVLVANKWDLIEDDPVAQKTLRDDVRRRFVFTRGAAFLTVSAKTGARHRQDPPRGRRRRPPVGHEAPDGGAEPGPQEGLRGAAPEGQVRARAEDPLRRPDRLRAPRSSVSSPTATSRSTSPSSASSRTASGSGGTSPASR